MIFCLVLGMPVAWSLAQWLEFLPTVYARLFLVSVTILVGLFVFSKNLKLSPLAPDPGRLVGPSLGGILMGLVLVGLTMAGMFVFEAVLPTGAKHVASLYAQKGLARPEIELPMTVVIVIAEEFIWREATPALLRRSQDPKKIWIMSVCLYGLAQIGSGSWLIVLTALIWGSVWSWLRIRTRSLIAPVLSHLIWTTSVLAFPLTPPLRSLT